MDEPQSTHSEICQMQQDKYWMISSGEVSRSARSTETESKLMIAKGWEDWGLGVSAF